MIQLAFITTSRKVVRFRIDGAKVMYFDEIWGEGVQIYPKDKKLISQLKESNKPNLKVMAALILDVNKGKDLKEYKSCNGDETKISEFIIDDCINKGLRLIK